MKRIERIYNWMSDSTQAMSWADLTRQGGFTTQVIAAQLDILRNNVSFELNNLLRLQQIIKIKGRPVGYLPLSAVERALGITLPAGRMEYDTMDELAGLAPPTLALLPAVASAPRNHGASDPFSALIGATGSLKNQVDQAKAAVLYPPFGLHTLITGQTGVGKSLFVSVMFSFARHAGRFEPEAPFIIFNCADYATNPQLLMAHIFGYVKGAFTGADSDRDGLIKKANGGMLFLDEIHRLPPEGQEMVFYFMDTGNYCRLGETERKQTARVLLAGATTEDPESSLLKTFVRRIPIIIHIPTFGERTANEKIELLVFLLTKEAHRIQKPIKIDAEAIKALIGNTAFGNIGQMKSNVQLVCANGFLHSIDNELITITFRDLPGEIKDGFFHLSGRRGEMQEITDRLEEVLVVRPEGEAPLVSTDDQYEPSFNLYSIIEGKVAFMQERGLSHEEIVRFITLDINIHLNSFYIKFQNNVRLRDNILKLVSKDILAFAQQIKTLTERGLNQPLTERFLLAFSLHLTSFLERVRNHFPVSYPKIETTLDGRKNEHRIALEIKHHIETTFNVTVPDIEVTYLTLLIGSLLTDPQVERVAVLVAMHGSSSASSMANVALKLLGEGIIDSIDMPLDLSPKVVLDQMRQRIKALDCGKGVLLLVDMGSLVGFGDIIMQETGIPVRTLSMVSTPTVIEAVRKSAVMNMELDDIYYSLCDFKGYGLYQKTGQQQDTSVLYQKTHAILSVCSTGLGTAQKLGKFVGGMLQTMGRDDIKVISMSLSEAHEQKEDILKRYALIMTLGIADPKMGVPFLPLEALFSSDGETQFTQLVQHSRLPLTVAKPHAMVRKISEESMTEFLTYLNPKKIIDLVLEFISDLEMLEGQLFDNGMKISLSVHVGSALERMVQNNGLRYERNLDDAEQQKIERYVGIAQRFEKKLDITLDRHELSHIMDMVNALLKRSHELIDDLL
ncbi:sigma 54-interacting transcriptional regulator [Acerihabitans sp. TG2]|uniref:sigma-54-dependent transcriptional regulator n=1 Tax=Acerihabitans sp. TG2 TaxID=3096008 RepID=UPI002B23C106|nr:sigma 54-interacting transcriptional regulator [Acerihabitans sp. TG2]MEA9390009.1 sigma 54-interacting transcriptional regulator [Acerihabitans sp. TG2]